MASSLRWFADLGGYLNRRVKKPQKVFFDHMTGYVTNFTWSWLRDLKLLLTASLPVRSDTRTDEQTAPVVFQTHHVVTNARQHAGTKPARMKTGISGN